jgi:hypothetical protein
MVEGVNGTTLAVDIDDNDTAEDTYEFTTGEGMWKTGTIAGAAGAVVELTGSAATVQGYVTVQCTGNGTAAIALE